MPDTSTITANGVTYDIKDAVARAAMNPILTLSVGTFSTLPKTISNASITADMVVLSCVFSNPSAITGNVAWTTSTGQLRLAGSISGSTSAQIVLGRSVF